MPITPDAVCGMRVHTLPIRSCAICHGLCRGKDTPPHCEIQPLLHRPGMLGSGQRERESVISDIALFVTAVGVLGVVFGLRQSYLERLQHFEWKIR